MRGRRPPSDPHRLGSSVESLQLEDPVSRGRGQILFTSFGRVGIVESDGTWRVFSEPSNVFPYWDPANSGDVATLPSSDSHPMARTWHPEGDRLVPTGAWPISNGTETFLSPDGRLIAYPLFNAEGRLRSGVVRIVDRRTAWRPDRIPVGRAQL